ncbi:hypothetical protein POM88_034722 [Heracleum sosnowskyi]|uniref:Uncharacterized protein n=2 Tax=Heracleum sosnowskyi TaxID=360622 RepID=A0AAD8MD90_9APIA|nr:hypothetical protein POM88_034719 [Heracleum sosnowskyi]KAK1368630.1 hypothetical protein POM88_034722 [Heracleum sosnowskyi]
MAPNISYTKFSPSGKVAYAITNGVALMEKESVHADFHPLMDFLKTSPVSYALTASPPIYAEIVQEMWSTADCSTTRGGINLAIKGKSYIITPSVINEALHFPESNFENTPTQSEHISMLRAINYAGNPSQNQVLKKKFRKEWSYFFDTLNKCFAGKCSSYDTINTFVLKIGYSLLYGRRIDIGTLLLDEFCYKFGALQERDNIIYYARFLMIIANYLCKDFCIEDRDDILQVHTQTKKLFTRLVTKNLNAAAEYVLPEHVQVQLSTLYSALSHTTSSLLPPTMEDMRDGYISPTQVALPSPYQSGTVANSSVSQSSGKRKRTISPCITEDGNEENGTAPEVHLPHKKKDASKVSSLSVADHEMPPAETRSGVPALDLPLFLEEEKTICGLHLPAQEPDDRQHLLNAASVLKSNLVDRLTSFSNILSADDMILLANKCYNTLEGLGDDYKTFSTEVNKLIGQHEELALAAKKKEDWNELDINSCYIQKAQSLFEVRQKLSRAKDKLSTAMTHEDSLKLKKEELTGALNKLTEELHEVEERVKTLTAERDQYKEAHSVAEAEVGKLEAEKEEARVAFKAINDQYIAANEEFEKTRNHLLQLVRK